MINGVHALMYAQDADAARAFLRDVMDFPAVDAGGGWLIFAMPPAELAIHPAERDGDSSHALYFMCDDVSKTVDALKRKGVKFTRPIADRGWGLLTTFRMPGGGEVGLYQPRHPTALGLGKKRPAKKPVKPASRTAAKRKPARRKASK